MMRFVTTTSGASRRIGRPSALLGVLRLRRETVEVEREILPDLLERGKLDGHLHDRVERLIQRRLSRPGRALGSAKTRHVVYADRFDLLRRLYHLGDDPGQRLELRQIELHRRNVPLYPVLGVDDRPLAFGLGKPVELPRRRA